MGMFEHRKKVIEKLSDERVETVLDFIEYLEEKEEWEATHEILRDEESMKNIKVANKAWESREMEEFVLWEKVKRDVQNSPPL
jgi:hypothetical protein